MFHSEDKIGPYTLMRRLGRGSFKEVWLAEKRTSYLTTQVAVGIPLDDDPDLEALKQEAQLWLHASGHANVLPVLEVEEYELSNHEKQIVIVSEYAPDGSLKDWLRQHGGTAPCIEAALTMITGILAGLEHLHSRRIIHRDIKPENVLLQGETPRLTDFGVSRLLHTTGRKTNDLSGTPAYMPPEALENHITEQSDLWATGVLLYRMLSGHLPFLQTELLPLAKAIKEDAPEPLSEEIPGSLRRVILRALEKDPIKRFRSAKEMREALQSILAPIRKPLVLPLSTSALPAPVLSPPPNNSVLVNSDPVALNIQSQPETSFASSSTSEPSELVYLPDSSPPNSPQTNARNILTQTSGVPAYVWLILLAMLSSAGFLAYQAYGRSHSGSLGASNPRNTRQSFSELPLKGQDDSSAISLFAPPANPSTLKQEKTNPKDDSVMVWIPAGEFTRGSNDYNDEKPQRHITLDGFWVYKNDVTVVQYRKFCVESDGKYTMPSAPSWGWKDDHPMVNVSWEEANAYSQWAGVSLPSEAQWEKVARGTDGRKYPWGNEWDSSKLRCSKQNNGDAGSTCAVGSYVENEYGVNDMVGNVWQWCADWYDENYYKISSLSNPTGPMSGRYRVLRGGSWFSSDIVDFRCSNRARARLTDRFNIYGFRCVAGVSSR